MTGLLPFQVGILRLLLYCASDSTGREAKHGGQYDIQYYIQHDIRRDLLLWKIPLDCYNVIKRRYCRAMY